MLELGSKPKANPTTEAHNTSFRSHNGLSDSNWREPTWIATAQYLPISHKWLVSLYKFLGLKHSLIEIIVQYQILSSSPFLTKWSIDAVNAQIVKCRWHNCIRFLMKCHILTLSSWESQKREVHEYLFKNRFCYSLLTIIVKKKLEKGDSITQKWGPK